jgi:nitrogen fixation NifU-like protein
MGGMENPEGYGKILGPCGDTMQIFLKVKDNKIVDARFITDGCATSMAAGSMATELAIGRKVQDLFKISPEVILKSLDGLPEDSIHCALLASSTLKEAVRNYLSSKREPWKKLYQQKY